MARALCHFKHLDLTQVPEAARARALLLQVPQFSPYSNTGHFAAWHEGHALIWYWDQDALLRSMNAAAHTPQRARVWPESVLYPPLNSGLRLVECLRGVEGQWWQDGCLRQCRWWQARPDAQEWLAFQRDIGLALEARQPAVPPAQSFDLHPAPMLRHGTSSGLLGGGWRDERLAYALGALLLFVPSAWIGAGMLKAEFALRDLRAMTGAVEARARPLIDSRREALRIASRSQALLALDPYPDQLDLMASVATALPKGRAYLKEWDFRDGKLKIALVTQGNTLSSSALVSALQLTGKFDNVQIAPGADPSVLTVSMNVLLLRAAARA